MAFYVAQKKTKKVLQLKRFPQVIQIPCTIVSGRGKNCDRRVPPLACKYELAKIRNSQLADGYRLPEIPIAAAVAAL
jgi:hypothetical protein